MKVNISIDGSPDEVRAFFGWPPVSHMHEELWKKMQEQMASGTPGYDPATMMKSMMPEQLQNMVSMQQAFWQQMAQKHDNEKK